MIPFARALQMVAQSARPLAARKVNIEDATGLCLSQSFSSPQKFPVFARALMDGYAVNFDEWKKQACDLECAGIIKAGDEGSPIKRKGKCFKIMTGAHVPAGMDTVIPVEHTNREDDRVRVMIPPEKGQNVCPQGKIIRKGQTILTQGTILKPEHIAVMASLGVKDVEVISKPKLAVLNTGGEIYPVGSKLPPNSVYNCNGPQLLSLLACASIPVSYLGIVPDRKKDLLPAIKQGLKADIFLITGGVSMGDYDLVPDMLIEQKVQKVFHKIKIKPGKPLFLGFRNGKMVFGLPGNPMSTFVNYQLFVTTAIKRMMGYAKYKPISSVGILSQDYRNVEKERTLFAPVKISGDGLRPQLKPIRTQGSADVLALSKAEAFMVLPPGERNWLKGSEIQYYPLQRNLYD